MTNEYKLNTSLHCLCWDINAKTDKMAIKKAQELMENIIDSEQDDRIPEFMRLKKEHFTLRNIKSEVRELKLK